MFFPRGGPNTSPKISPTAPPARPAPPDTGHPSDVRPRFLLASLALVVPLAAAAAGTASPPTVAEKQTEAARVLAEIGRIDRQLSHTVDAYDGARVQLGALDGQLRRNRAALVRARRTLRVAQARLERRMVLIYTSEQPTAIDILLGASSLSDLVDELDAARNVAAQDDEIAREAAAAKADLEHRQAELERARRAQRQTGARVAATRAPIQSPLAAQRERERVRAQRRAAAATTTSASRAPSAPAAPATPPPSPPPSSSSPPS